MPKMAAGRLVRVWQGGLKTKLWLLKCLFLRWLGPDLRGSWKNVLGLVSFLLLLMVLGSLYN